MARSKILHYSPWPHSDANFNQAPAEAEAELAFLNREGHIDAIMSDDCDTFIFGARTVFKK